MPLSVENVKYYKVFLILYYIVLYKKKKKHITYFLVKY